MHPSKRFSVLTALLLTISVAVTSCQSSKESSVTNGIIDSSLNETAVINGTVIEPTTGNATVTSEPETAPEMVTADTPIAGNFSPAGETVVSLGNEITVDGSGVTVNDNVITVAHAGTYVFSGVLNGGQIVVDTADESKIILIFNGVSVACATGPALLVKSAPKKVVISTAEGSVNILSDGSDYVIPDDQQTEGEIYPNACIYSCEDIDFEGMGALHITGNADKGINTKDDLKIKGGTLVITSAGVGIRANDSLTVSGGTVTVLAGADGVKTANTETEGKGFLTVEGGSLFITAKGDGLSAATNLTVSGGNLVLTTTDADGEVLKEAAENPTTSSGGGFGGMGGGRPGGPGGMMEGNSNKSEISAKGLKAVNTLTVNGGKITVVSQDDGLHSDGDVYITEGTIHIRAADDGIHAEKELTIAGGVLTVAQSYEGLEGLHVTIMGGTNRITASDDGANATNGEGGGFGGGPGGFPGGGTRPRNGGTTATEASENAPLLKFTGGYTIFNAGGDGIDSNGNIDITGGTVIVYGPTDSMNGPIDSGDGNYGVTISGGLLLAVGSSGMAETAENNGQAVLAASWRSGGLPAGETIGIVDENGKVLAAFELPKAIQSIVFSCTDLVSGQTYSIVGGGTTTADIVDGVIDPATYTGYESMGEIKAN